MGAQKVQIEFLRDRGIAQIGQKADSVASTVVSSSCPETVGFGSLLVYDDSDRFLCQLPKTKAQLEKPLGIALRQLHCMEYAPKANIAIMRKGRVWVYAEKVEAPADSVYVKISESGQVSFTAVKTGNHLLKNAVFLEKCEAGLVPIEINFVGGV